MISFTTFPLGAGGRLPSLGAGGRLPSLLVAPPGDLFILFQGDHFSKNIFPGCGKNHSQILILGIIKHNFFCPLTYLPVFFLSVSVCSSLD